MTNQSLLDTVLEPGGLWVVFQPIFEVRQAQGETRLHALECLTRGPRGTNLEKPGVLFEYVRRKRAESLVDRVCVSAALEQGRRLPCEPHLHLNVHASTLGLDGDFVSALVETAHRSEIDVSRLTIEIVEHAPYWDGPAFLRALERLRMAGVRIALDDIGLGESNYRMILDTRPDYFKVDRYVVQGCHRDSYRAAILESVGTLATRFGARVVAEGVEDPEELVALRQMGVELVQGFLLGKPTPREELTVQQIRGSDELSGFWTNS